MLIKAGARLDPKDATGQTAAELAAATGNAELADWLTRAVKKVRRWR